MRTVPEPNRPLHRKSLAVLEEIRSLLESCARGRKSECLRLEINLNQGIPSRLTCCQELRREIPLSEQP